MSDNTKVLAELGEEPLHTLNGADVQNNKNHKYFTDEEMKENCQAKQNNNKSKKSHQEKTQKNTLKKIVNMVKKTKKSRKGIKRRNPRLCLSEIILGLRKKGRPKVEDQASFTKIKKLVKNFKDRFDFTPSSKPTDPTAPLSKYLSYKKASLTPLECYVHVSDVFQYFSKDIQEYLKSGLTLFNVQSILTTEENSELSYDSISMSDVSKKEDDKVSFDKYLVLMLKFSCIIFFIYKLFNI